MTNGEDQCDVFKWLVAVKGNIAASAVRDDELAQLMLARTADERMSLQYFYAIANDVDRCDRGTRSFLEKGVGQSFEIGKGLARIDYFRHARAFGRGVCRPRVRVAM